MILYILTEYITQKESLLQNSALKTRQKELPRIKLTSQRDKLYKVGN